MFQWIMGNLPGTKQPLLRASVVVAAFVSLPVLSAGINDTGITACADARTTSADCATVSADGGSFPRQDGRYGAGAGFDFTKIANDGSVLSRSAALGTSATDWACTRDNVTGLMWEVKTSSGLRSQSHTYKWYQSGSGVASKNSEPSTCQTAGHCDTDQFATDVNKEGLCGVVGGWRMPTVKELENIVDFGRNNPSVDTTYFPDTLSGDYWSGTNDAFSPGEVAWNVSFTDGMVSRQMTSNLAYVRLVFGTRETSTYKPVTLPNGDTAVTDSRTGLMWKREHEMIDPSQPNDWETRVNVLTWQAALQRAVNDRTGGYSDWRLPNIKELRSLVDESRFKPALDPIFMPPPALGWFWSSSPYMGNPGVQRMSIMLHSAVGSDAAVGREVTQYARLVRGGNDFDKFGGTVSLDASPLNFGSRSLNTTSTAQTFTLGNIGSGSITITGITASASDYTQTNTCSATLAPGSTCTISVTFTPSVEGARTGTVTIASNAPGSPHSVSLGGTGALVPGVSLSPGALAFGTPQGLNTSETKIITLANTASASITGIGITVSAGDYTQINTCSATLAPSSTCHINVTFTPTAVGSRTGVITITSSAVDNPHRVSLTGTGIVILHSLTVTKLGTGGVTSSPAGIDCGTVCQASFANDTLVTLRATAGGSSTFDGWSSLNCPGSGNCNVSMSGAQNVTATFTAKIVSGYMLTVQEQGTGRGTMTSILAGIDCGARCSALQGISSMVELVAVAAPGSTFTGWSGGGCSGTNTCTVTMNGPVDVFATFTANTVTVTNYMLNVNKLGTGTVSASSTAASNINCGSACSVAYPAGTNVALSAIAGQGGTFTGWSGDCSGMGPCAPYMNRHWNVTATFTSSGSANSYALTVNEQGTGRGTMTSSPQGIDCGALCSNSFPSSSSVTLTAKAAEGSTFAGWSGDCLSTATTCTVTMSKAQKVFATFAAINSYKLSVTKSGNGTVSSDTTGINCGAECSRDYPANTSVTLSAKAAEGSTFAGWTGANCSGTSNSCKVNMTEARTVTANFTLTPVSSVALYDGIYQWAEGEYLSLHQQPANKLVATIYRVHTSDTLTVGTLSSPATDTFDLLNEGTISGSTATISGKGFFRACKLSYKLELNDDSSLTVTRTDVSNNTGVSVADVDCAARYNSVGTVWKIPRIF